MVDPKPFQFTLRHVLLVAPGASVFFAFVSFTGGIIPALVMVLPATYFLLLFLNLGAFCGRRLGREQDGYVAGYAAWIIASILLFWLGSNR